MGRRWSRAGEVARAERSGAAEVGRAHSTKASSASLPDAGAEISRPEKLPGQRSRGPRKLPVLMQVKKVQRVSQIARAEISRAGEVARAEISPAAEVGRAHSIKESPESFPDPQTAAARAL